jgi:hypothetical protein
MCRNLIKKDSFLKSMSMCDCTTICKCETELEHCDNLDDIAEVLLCVFEMIFL